MMCGLRIRLHPTLDILVREDGAVLLPKGWSFGAKAHPESRKESVRRYAEKRRDRRKGKA